MSVCGECLLQMFLRIGTVAQFDTKCRSPLRKEQHHDPTPCMQFVLTHLKQTSISNYGYRTRRDALFQVLNLSLLQFDKFATDNNG